MRGDIRALVGGGAGPDPRIPALSTPFQRAGAVTGRAKWWRKAEINDGVLRQLISSHWSKSQPKSAARNIRIRTKLMRALAPKP